MPKRRGRRHVRISCVYVQFPFPIELKKAFGTSERWAKPGGYLKNPTRNCHQLWPQRERPWGRDINSLTPLLLQGFPVHDPRAEFPTGAMMLLYVYNDFHRPTIHDRIRCNACCSSLSNRLGSATNPWHEHVCLNVAPSLHFTSFENRDTQQKHSVRIHWVSYDTTAKLNGQQHV